MKSEDVIVKSEGTLLTSLFDIDRYYLLYFGQRLTEYIVYVSGKVIPECYVGCIL